MTGCYGGFSLCLLKFIPKPSTCQIMLLPSIAETRRWAKKETTSEGETIEKEGMGYGDIFLPYVISLFLSERMWRQPVFVLD
jgi:hypothetical protein